MIRLKKVEDGEYVFVNPRALALIERDGELRCRVFVQAGSTAGAAICINADMPAAKVLAEIEDWERDQANMLRR